MIELLCPWEGAKYLIYSSNVPALLYYSHIPAIIAALSIIFLVLRKSRRNSVTTSLSVMLSLFTFWVIADLILWATNRPDTTMFFWSIQILLEVLIYAAAFYTSYIFVSNRDLSFLKKCFLLVPVALFVLLTPTELNLTGVELETCYAQENNVIIYLSYALETILTIAIVTTAFKHYKLGVLEKRKQIFYYTFGILIFLLALTYGNVIGSFSDDWVLAQYGLFGMPVFIGFLAYLIVRFKLFNIKLLAAQALVFTLVVLIGSQFFFIQNPTNKILNGITLFFSLTFGYFLVRSVKKEVEQREKIEIQEKELEKANERLKELDQLKSEFVSLATHQIRGPLTSIKGYASMILEGDYGEVPKVLQEPVDTIYQSSQSLVVIVEDFLNVSRIEQGKMKYDFTDVDLCALVNEVVNESKPIIDRRGLNVSSTICPSPVNVHGDRGKLKQVIGNLLDNSMKYTPKGSIALTLESDKVNKRVRLSIKDTGVGISAETIPHLFQKFSRAEDASKVNILGTGLGLYVANEMIKAHGGRIWVESPGVGKGATFFVELALV